MNFIVINKQSNLITGVISSSAQPTNDAKTLFIKVGELTLKKFYRLSTKAFSKGLLVDAGELASISHSFLDSLIETDKNH